MRKDLKKIAELSAKITAEQNALAQNHKDQVTNLLKWLGIGDGDEFSYVYDGVRHTKTVVQTFMHSSDVLIKFADGTHVRLSEVSDA